jgi:hypothetical protein
MMLALGSLAALALAAAAVDGAVVSKTTTWHVVWTGGQSNSVGTNSQKSGMAYL